MPKKRKLTPEKEQEYREWGLEPPKVDEAARKRGKASRRKGKRGEREIAKIFREAGLPDVGEGRFVQAAAGSVLPDVWGWILDAEVKYQQSLQLDKAYLQAVGARRPGQVACVISKKNNKPRMVHLALDDFLEIVVNAMRWQERS